MHGAVYKFLKLRISNCFILSRGGTVIVHFFNHQEIKPETAEEMTQRIQELYTLFDRVNEQLQTVQASSEMQRILQVRPSHTSTGLTL